jgi:hypothetical protein
MRYARAFFAFVVFHMSPDALPYVLEASLLGFAHDVFELGEDLFDRVEIGAVGRQEEEL